MDIPTLLYFSFILQTFILQTFIIYLYISIFESFQDERKV